MSAATLTGTENAIEFELSIDFRGRKYTARRTMQCIIKLRDDLVREMRHRRRWMTMMNGRSGGFATTGSNNPPTTTDHYDHNGLSLKAFHDWDETIQIPEIPPLLSREAEDGSVRWHDYASSSYPATLSTNSFGMTSPSFVGRGFTTLRNMVESYVPIMDRWLRSVMMIVPQDSECLSNFLWEPDHSNDKYYSSLSLIGEKSGSMSLSPAATSMPPTLAPSSSSSIEAPVVLKPSNTSLTARELSAISEMDYCTSDDDDDDGGDDE
jgi:hypothetical protein